MENNETLNTTNNNNSNSKEISFKDLAKSLRFPDRLLIPPSKAHLLRFESISEVLQRNKDAIDRELQLIPTIDSITDRAGAIIAEYFAAFSLGALLGASITTGILFGTYFATSFLNRHFKLFKKRHSDNNKPSSNTVCIIPPSKSIILLNEIASLPSIQTKEVNIKYTCLKNCLDTISTKLEQRNLSWKNVQKITVYLVLLGVETQLYSGGEFRSFLKEYVQNSMEEMMVNIIFVQCLENEAIMQIEVLATK